MEIYAHIVYIMLCTSLFLPVISIRGFYYRTCDLLVEIWPGNSSLLPVLNQRTDGLPTRAGKAGCRGGRPCTPLSPNPLEGWRPKNHHLITRGIFRGM